MLTPTWSKKGTKNLEEPQLIGPALSWGWTKPSKLRYPIIGVLSATQHEMGLPAEGLLELLGQRLQPRAMTLASFPHKLPKDLEEVLGSLRKLQRSCGDPEEQNKMLRSL